MPLMHKLKKCKPKINISGKHQLKNGNMLTIKSEKIMDNLLENIEELIDDIERDHAITKTEILEALYKIKSEIEDHNLKYEEETDY
tara:strand:+ start:104 stop:361 length:258 start_codon:yes stop_codon:yes gene_type:complete